MKNHAARADSFALHGISLFLVLGLFAQPAAAEAFPEAFQLDEVPGSLVFEGKYLHRSRGREIAPTTMWLKQAPDGALTAVSFLPAFSTTYVAYGAPDGRLVRYREVTRASGGRPASERSLALEDGKAALTTTDAEGATKTEEHPVPPGAVFDPNSTACCPNPQKDLCDLKKRLP